jgi:hypothetical protein
MKVRLRWMACVCVLGVVACATFIFWPMRTPEPVAQASGLVMVIDGSKEGIAPPESVTAGSTWIKFAVRYENRGLHSIWLDGYSADNVFCDLETRSDEQDNWAAYGMGYCDTGAQMLEIQPGESHNFTVALPERYRGKEFRVVLNYYATALARGPTRAASLPRKVTVTE